MALPRVYGAVLKNVGAAPLGYYVEPSTLTSTLRRSFTVVFGCFFANFFVTNRPVVVSRCMRGTFGFFLAMKIRIGTSLARRESRQ